MNPIQEHINFLENRINEIQNILTINHQKFTSESQELEMKKTELENEYINKRKELEISYHNLNENKSRELYQLEGKLIQKEKRQLILKQTINNICLLEPMFPTPTVIPSDSLINLNGLTKFLYHGEKNKNLVNNNLQKFPQYNEIIRLNKYINRKKIINSQKKWSKKIINLNKEIYEYEQIIEINTNKIKQLEINVKQVKDKHKADNLNVIKNQECNIINKITDIETIINENIDDKNIDNEKYDIDKNNNKNKLSDFLLGQYRLKLKILNIKLERLRRKRFDIINDIGQIPNDMEIVHYHKIKQLNENILNTKNKIKNLLEMKDHVIMTMKTDQSLFTTFLDNNSNHNSNSDKEYHYQVHKIQFNDIEMENNFKYKISIIHKNKLLQELVRISSEITDLQDQINIFRERMERFNIKTKDNHKYQLSNLENTFNQNMGKIIGKINILRNKYINKETIENLQKQRMDIIEKLKKLRNIL